MMMMLLLLMMMVMMMMVMVMVVAGDAAGSRCARARAHACCRTDDGECPCGGVCG